jgi:hypothetical protein
MMTDFPTGNELDEMVRDLGHEMGCPWDINPDLVDLDTDPEKSWAAGCNRGCVTADGEPDDGVTRYAEGQRWRRKLIDELARRPEWIAEWRAEAEHDRRIRGLCKAKGLRFLPHEVAPWEVPSSGECPYDPHTGGYASWPKAQRLRRQLERELSAQVAAAKPRRKAARVRP